MRICKHEVPEGERFCKFCGSNQIQIANNLPCVWRDVGDKRYGEVRPEPKLRTIVHEDVDSIYNRIQELKQDDTRMINHIDEVGVETKIEERSYENECY